MEDSTLQEKVIPKFVSVGGAGNNIVLACSVSSTVNARAIDAHMVFSQTSQPYLSQMMTLTNMFRHFMRVAKNNTGFLSESPYSFTALDDVSDV